MLRGTPRSVSVCLVNAGSGNGEDPKKVLDLWHNRSTWPVSRIVILETLRGGARHSWFVKLLLVINTATLSGRAMQQGSQNLPFQEALHSHPNISPLALQSHNWFPAQHMQWLLRISVGRKTSIERGQRGVCLFVCSLPSVVFNSTILVGTGLWFPKVRNREQESATVYRSRINTLEPQLPWLVRDVSAQLEARIKTQTVFFCFQKSVSCFS